MSCFRATQGTLPPNPPILNLDSHLQNYQLLRSFTKNWSVENVIHYPNYRPAAGIVAGNHYFECFTPAFPLPVLCVTFVCCPAITATLPIFFSLLPERFPFE